MTTLAIIPARGGSKGLKNKNMLRLGGKTLIQLAVECARESGVCDRIVVNSDSQEILDHADEIGVEKIRRPAPLATDIAPTEHVVLQTLWCCQERGNYDAVFVLQPTTPQRTPEQLRHAMKLLGTPWKPAYLDFADGHTDFVFISAPCREPWQKLHTIDAEGYVEFASDPNEARRQLHGKPASRCGTYLLTGERALSGRWYDGKCRSFIGPGLSIDSQEDWEEVQRLWEKREYTHA